MITKSIAMKMLAAGAIVTLGGASADAGPAALREAPAAAQSLVEKAQVGIYFDYGRPYYRPYRPYPYYRYRYYEAPPPVTYYETRPYVVERARPPAARGYDPDAVARCASRFRSFNVNTGTYITLDGEERLCPYLR